MCEIAVIPNPLPTTGDGSDNDEQYQQATRALTETCRTLYDENPDGLGVVAVRRDEDTFDYSMFKAVEPDFGADADLYEFFEQNDDAWRFAIHARLKTHGGIGYAQTHPILVGGCPEIEGIRYVMHNGVIRNEAKARRDLEADGHEFNTHVDSEIIAHAFGSLPTHEDLSADAGEDDSDDDDESESEIEFEEPDEIRGRANFILFGDDRILLRMENKYNTKTNFTVLCNRRQEASVEPDHDYTGKHYGLITPDGESSFRSAPRRYAGGRYNVRSGGTSRAGVWGYRGPYAGYTNESRTDDEQTTLESATEDEESVREQTRGNPHDDREPVGTTVVADPDKERRQSSYYCNDHGWHDELIEDDCPRCVRERNSHGGLPNHIHRQGVDYCEEHDQYYNSALFSECSECSLERSGYERMGSPDSKKAGEQVGIERSWSSFNG